MTDQDVITRTSRYFKTHYGTAPMACASAHGRANLSGEHTDYNDGIVLPFLITHQTGVGVSLRNDDLICGCSNRFAEARKSCDAAVDGSWLDFVIGALHQLVPVGGNICGVDVAIVSEVPPGAGVSSSAALEVALLRALAAAQQLRCPDNAVLAQMAQRIEHDFIGTKCGIMDQMVVATAVPKKAMRLDCRNLDHDFIALPPDHCFVIVHSGSTRNLSASLYNKRLRECRAAASLLGVGALRDAKIEMLAGLEMRPELIRARHVITENARVIAAVDCLGAGDVAGLGALMNDSHRSLRDDYAVSSDVLDHLVASLRRAGAYGARLTGAGFGGCVVAVCASDRVATMLDQAMRDNPASYLVDVIAG